jgi:hypothetical protein
VGEGQDNNAVGAVERVTIAEAATLLGCRPNTVRSRVKAGMYRAEKVHTENGPTWMIERDSLTTNATTSARQQGVGGVPVVQQEALQELASAIARESEIAKLRDPEQEAQLEANKIQAEGAKTQVAVAGGSLVGIAAIVGFLPTQHGAVWLLGALFAIFVSLASGYMYISHIAEETAAQRYAPDSFVFYWGRFLLPAGLTAFALYVMLNLPFLNSEGDRIPVGEVRLVVFWAFLGVGAFLTTYTLKSWVLRRRTRRRSAQEDTAAR